MNNFNADNELNNLNNLLDQRYSCRAFLNKAVSKSTILKILSCAQKVPSWCNAQPWEVSIVTEAKLVSLKKLTIKAGLDRLHKTRYKISFSLRGCLQTKTPRVC